MSRRVKLDFKKDVFHIKYDEMIKYNKIRKVYIHENIIKIDYGSFFNKKDLEKVQFSKNSKVYTIPERCFEECNSLKEILLPKSLSKIEKNAFKNCYNIKELHLPNDIIEVDPDAFYGWNEDQVIYSPIELKQPLTNKAKIIVNKNEEEQIKEERIILNKDGENYFLIELKCGHVGRHRYIPITFPVIAKDLKSAVAIARRKGRVKRDHKDVVLSYELVNKERYDEQIKINEN